MKKKISILCLVLLFAIFSAGATLAQTNAVVIKPTAKLYKKPNAKLKVAETLKQGRRLKLESTKPIRGWYKVTIILDEQPQNEDEAFEAFSSEYRIYWIHGNDIKIQSNLTDSNSSQTTNEWVEYASDEESFYNYNPAKTNRRGSLIQVGRKSAIKITIKCFQKYFTR